MARIFSVPISFPHPVNAGSAPIATVNCRCGMTYQSCCPHCGAADPQTPDVAEQLAKLGDEQLAAIGLQRIGSWRDRPPLL